MIIIRIAFVILYFIINSVILLVWTMDDGFVTRYKFIEAIVLLVAGLPIMIFLFVYGMVHYLFGREE